MGRAAAVVDILLLWKDAAACPCWFIKKRFLLYILLLYTLRYKLTHPTVDLSIGTSVFAFGRWCCFLFLRIGSTGRRTSVPGLREIVERFNLISYNNIVALVTNNNIILWYSVLFTALELLLNDRRTNCIQCKHYYFLTNYTSQTNIITISSSTYTRN